MSNSVTLLDYLIVLAKHKKKLVIHFFIVSVVAVTISLLLPKQYKSDLTFIPQGSGQSEISSLLMTGNLGADIFGGASLLKRQYVVLLDSRELREQVINKFNLVEEYKNTRLPNPMDQTLLQLEKNLKTSVEEEGGLGLTNVLAITITAIDKDPVRAADMANYAFSLVENKTIVFAQKENDDLIEFIERQMTLCDENLEKAREEKLQFQLENRAYNISQQISSILQAAGTMKAEVLALESQKEFLKQTRKGDYKGIAALDQKINSINRKISDLETVDRKNMFPALNQALSLSDEFTDLFKEVETYIQLRLFLRQQLEQARIKRARDYSSAYIVDRARPAEYKFKPKRALIALGIVSAYMFVMVSFLLLRDHYIYLREKEPDRLEKIDALVSNLGLSRKK